MHPSGVCQALIPLLMAAVVGCVQVSERSVGLASERSSIERTYELTKYLDHQLKEIKDTYLSYLGPPFNDPDFSPPRPNSSALALPSAATRVDLWRGLENGARLAQNQRAYSVLLCAVRELARSTLCPYLQSSLLHFCSGLSGLLGSISGLMNTLGYTPPPLGQAPPSLHSPAPLRSPTLRNHEQRGSAGTAGGSREGERDTERRRERERERAERGRRGRRREEESWAEAEEEELARHGGMERWGRRRRLLSMEEEQSKRYDYNPNNNNNNNRNGNSAINSFHNNDTSTDISINTNVNTNRHANGPIPTVTERNKAQELSREEEGGKTREAVSVLLYSSPSLHPRRSRSLPSPQPPLSPLSLLYQYGGAVTDGHSLLTTPVISYRPAPNDFSRKVEGFWVLRELQSWLWRSAKDFNRLKKRLRA